MAKKKKSKTSSGGEKRELNLETSMDKFSENCERCGEKLSVHAYRKRSQTKKEAIYASCINKGVCPRFHLEICFIEKFF